jgi:hypothetical protein
LPMGLAGRNINFMVINNLKEERMKVVTLCKVGSCCPVVKIMDTHVEIGEDGNMCVLTAEHWETLKQKILEGSC